MLTQILGVNGKAQNQKHQEGELYKVINVYGKTFEIYYGYYEDKDRYSKYAEPIEVYPNFIQNPQYTDEGVPFVTAIQKPCEYFRGELDEENTCYQCKHYERCEELLGVCRCEKRIKV